MFNIELLLEVMEDWVHDSSPSAKSERERDRERKRGGGRIALVLLKRKRKVKAAFCIIKVIIRNEIYILQTSNSTCSEPHVGYKIMR